jgi:hypothetical protein
MATTMTPSTMTTTNPPSTDRVPETVYQSVYDSIDSWPEPEASLARTFFQANKDRLLVADSKCIRELQLLLNIRCGLILQYGRVSAGGRFIVEMKQFTDYFSEVVEERAYQEKRKTYRALLDTGDWVAWMDALQAARDEVRIVDERGMMLTDEHAHLQLLDGVWAEWRKAHP